MSMIMTYTQVENALGIHLRYSQILLDFSTLPGMRESPWIEIIGIMHQRG